MYTGFKSGVLEDLHPGHMWIGSTHIQRREGNCLKLYERNVYIWNEFNML